MCHFDKRNKKLLFVDRSPYHCLDVFQFEVPRRNEECPGCSNFTTRVSYTNSPVSTFSQCNIQ